MGGSYLLSWGCSFSCKLRSTQHAHWNGSLQWHLLDTMKFASPCSSEWCLRGMPLLKISSAKLLLLDILKALVKSLSSIWWRIGSIRWCVPNTSTYSLFTPFVGFFSPAKRIFIYRCPILSVSYRLKNSFTVKVFNSKVKWQW